MGRAEVKNLKKKGLSIKQIAARLGLHRNTVARILKEPSDREYRRPERGDAAKPYEAQVLHWLADKVPIERMLEMVQELPEGAYTGSRSAFYAGVARIRETAQLAKAERFVSFEGLPGEYAQVDWGEVRAFSSGRSPPRSTSSRCA